jgi:hypothetical protein
MARLLDFNTIEVQTLDIVLRDEARTKVHLRYPTEGLVQELIRISPEMHKVLETGDGESLNLTYDLVARLINCNRDGIKVTGEELRTKYNMDFEMVIVFCSSYLEFLNETTNAKN